MKFKILCVFICYVYFTRHFFACLDVWEVVSIYFKSLCHLQVSYGSVYGLEIEKQCMRLERSLNNLMTDKLATSNKIKSCSVVLHMLLLQAVSVRELNQTEPSSVSKLVWYLELFAFYETKFYAKSLLWLFRSIIILLGMWFSTVILDLTF